MTEQQTQEVGREYTYRVGFKQTAKGVWYAEFTVRADDITALKEKVLEARTQVLNQLQTLNMDLNNGSTQGGDLNGT